MRYRSPIRRSLLQHKKSLPHSGRLQYVSIAIAVLSLVVSMVGASVNFGSFRRDRADVNVVAHAHVRIPIAFVEGLYRNIKVFGRAENDREARDWCVMTVVNRGRRPIHIEKVRLHYVAPNNGLAESVMFIPWDETLTEERRSASFAFERSPNATRTFRSAHVIDDAGAAYVVHPESIEQAAPWAEPRILRR